MEPLAFPTIKQRMVPVDLFSLVFVAASIPPRSHIFAHGSMRTTAAAHLLNRIWPKFLPDSLMGSTVLSLFHFNPLEPDKNGAFSIARVFGALSLSLLTLVLIALHHDKGIQVSLRRLMRSSGDTLAPATATDRGTGKPSASSHLPSTSQPLSWRAAVTSRPRCYVQV